MRKYEFSYDTEQNQLIGLAEFKNQVGQTPGSKMLLQVYSQDLREDVIADLRRQLEINFPDVPYMGCTTSGNIVDCKQNAPITIVGTIFEKPTTNFSIVQYDMERQTVEEITSDIVIQANQKAGIKAIEIYFTIPEVSYTQFCEGLDDVLPQVQIFGGVSCSNDITSNDSFVFSKGEAYSGNSLVVIFYGGEDFFVSSIKMTGWKPLQRTFHVTKSDGNCLQELDGIPAFDVYQRYLNIGNDADFFYNTLEFPLLYQHNDTTILRVPLSSNEDNSITMSSDIEEGSEVCLSYGDPRMILKTIEEKSEELRKFQPDLMHIFSCAARKAFWNQNEPTYELIPLEDISPSVGFFSHGEFIRLNTKLNQHNVTLVIAAMREGEKHNTNMPNDTHHTQHEMDSRLPLASRLATFIGESAKEMEQMNSRLKEANEKLKAAVIIDGLTGLYNRKEIQKRIEKSLNSVAERAFSVIMMDIDNFKQVNDTYGHQEGDAVIIALSEILKSDNISPAGEFSAGRWGGEEFMLLLPDANLHVAALVAELVRKTFENTTYPIARSQTISIGVTQATQADTIDTLCTRVDAALYKAKKDGKNRVITG